MVYEEVFYIGEMDYGRTIPRIWLEFILKNYGSRPKRSDLHRFQVELRWKAMVLGKMTRLTRDFQKGWSDQAGGSTTYWPMPIPNLRLACSYYLCVGWFHALHPLILKDSLRCQKDQRIVGYAWSFKTIRTWNILSPKPSTQAETGRNNSKNC